MWHSNDFLEVSVPAKNRVDNECWLFSSIVLCLSATDPVRPLDMILHPSLFIFHDWAHLRVLRKEGVLFIITFPCELIGQFRYFKIQL